MRDTDNDRTLQTYNDHIAEYVSGTPQTIYSSLKNWMDKALRLIPKGGAILELGSGFGRDATYMKSLGYHVTATDAAQGFIDLLQKAGHEARMLNALTDDFGNGYDMVFAHAVLLHFTPEQTDLVIKKAFESLKSDGILAFSLKQGSGSKWTDEKLGSPRRFYYWQKPALEKLLEATAFSDFAITEGKSKNADWLYVIAKK
jgi:2-polyprenyl-3-methyl-5-hydroxy-6-metoxy-1,4-benzoquinol methylase